MADEQDTPPADETGEQGTGHDREQDRDDAGQSGADEREQRRRDRGLDDDQGDERDDPDAEHLGDAGKRALDRMKAANKAQARELAEMKAELQQYRDKDKTETERLTEKAETATARAAKAETSLKALQAALEHAPEGATLDHVRKCAKRIRGDSDDELAADAAELYDLMDIRKAEKPKPGGKPRERLRPGGTDPEEPVEETDPAKLAALIPRG